MKKFIILPKVNSNVARGGEEIMKMIDHLVLYITFEGNDIDDHSPY